MDADIPSNYVAQLSGHKNLKSLDSYKTASRVHQRKMSNILSRSSSTSCQQNNDSVPAGRQTTSSSSTISNRVMNYEHANSAVNAQSRFWVVFRSLHKRMYFQHQVRYKQSK